MTSSGLFPLVVNLGHLHGGVCLCLGRLNISDPVNENEYCAWNNKNFRNPARNFRSFFPKFWGKRGALMVRTFITAAGYIYLTKKTLIRNERRKMHLKELVGQVNTVCFSLSFSLSLFYLPFWSEPFILLLLFFPVRKGGLELGLPTP